MKLSNKATRWIRIIHRDLGFLMVGVCLIYAISGILLNHMDGKDPAFDTQEKRIDLLSNLSNKELQVMWNDKKDVPTLKKVLPIDGEYTRLMLEGGVGVYNRNNGSVDYEIHSKRQFVYWINKLHYNQVKGWSIMADFFAISLIFFAISGLVMVKGKHSLKGSGKWYLAIGILIPIIYVMLT